MSGAELPGCNKNPTAPEVPNLLQESNTYSTYSNLMHHSATQPLPPRQERAIQVLIASPGIDSAAQQIGCHRTTIHRWLNDPAFQARLQEAQQKAADLTAEVVVDEVRSMLARHSKLSQEMLSAASREFTKRIKEIEASEEPVLSIEELRRLFDTAVRVERLSRGVPDSIQENQVKGTGGVALEMLDRAARVALFEQMTQGEGPA